MAFDPAIRQTQTQDQQKNEHLKKYKNPKGFIKFSKLDGPGNNKEHFNVENQKEDRYDVIANIKPDPRRSDGMLAALVGGRFLRIEMHRPEKPVQNQIAAYKYNRCQDENQRD